MDKLESQTSKESASRNRLARHVTSGKSVAAFCRDEAISASNFYAWRTRLANGDNGDVLRPAPRAEFIHLGAVNSTAAERPPATMTMPGIDIRIDLGGGVVLTIARR
jgi:putative transposase